MSIAIANQKGGVTKTSTITHLAYLYADYLKKKTLLIDLDPQKDASALFVDNYNSIPKEETIYASFYDRPLQIRETRINNLYIVPSHLKMANVDGELKGNIGAERLLENAIKQVESDFDEIFIDCPPALGYILTNALTATKNLIIPISHLGFETEGLTDLIETIKKVKSAYNPELKIQGLIQTMVDSTSLCTTFRQDIIEKYGDLVLKSSTSRSIHMSEAISKLITIFELKAPRQKKERICKEYIALAKELYSITHPTLHVNLKSK